jgi:hypothetical protein
MDKSKLKYLLKKEMTRKDFLSVTALAVISVIGIGGVIAELISHAEGRYTSGNPKTGTLAGGAKTVASTTALGSEEVQFEGASTSTIAPPTGPTGSWTLAWNDEFDDSAGSSGPNNGLNLKKWNGGYGTGPATIGGLGQNVVTQGVQEHGAGQEGNGNFQGPGAISLKSDGIHLDCISSPYNVPDSYNVSPYNEVECGAIHTAGLLAFNPANTSYNSVIQDAINAGTITSINSTFVVEYVGKYPGPGYTAPGSGVLNSSNIPLWWPAVWFTNMDYNPSSASSNWPGGGSATGWTEEVDVWESYACGIYGDAIIGEHVNFAVPHYNEDDVLDSIPSQFATTDMGLAFHTYTFEVSNSGNTITAWVDGVEAFTNSSYVQSGGNFATPQYLGWTMQTHYPGNEGSVGTLPAGPPVTTNEGIYHGWTISYVRVFVPA